MFRFPWGDMHSLNLGWFLQKFNELREDWATAEAGIDGALDAEIQRAEDALSDVFDARDAAAASATAAAGSASSAGTSATAAQNSATAAASSATLANNKATAAGLSEAAAAQSATQAGNSATAAAGSATTASAAATNAAASQTAAGNSATAAAGSATAAATSETNAAASAARAEAVEESIPEDYSALSADVTGLKTALTELFAICERQTPTYWDTSRSIFGTLTPGVKYKLVINVTTEFTLATFQAGINYTQGGMIDTIASNITFIVGENVFDYIPSEAVSTFRFLDNASNVSSFKIYGIADDSVYIATKLDDFIAPSALATNQFIIIGSRLFRVTRPVSEGETLTVNTNIEATSIAEQLQIIRNRLAI